MNERIRELSEQAEKYADDNFRGEPTWSEAFESKFAELIVAECINKVRSRQMFGIEDEHNIHHAFDLLVYDLESYFGVKE
jgi:hypothetical protein